MKTSDVLLALLIVLILAVVYKLTTHGGRNEGFTPSFMPEGGSYGYLGGEGEYFRSPYEARAELNNRLDNVRGMYRSHDYPYTPTAGNWNYPLVMNSGSNLTPEDISSAEAEEWYAATSRDNTGGFNAELANDMQADTMQYHTSEPGIDYGSFITDIIVDPRTHENHQKWVSEMTPFSGTPTMVDNLDEALEASINFTGLRRPQAVSQYNPTFVTEIDSRILAGNCPFNFRC